MCVAYRNPKQATTENLDIRLKILTRAKPQQIQRKKQTHQKNQANKQKKGGDGVGAKMYADYTYYEKIYFGKSIPPDEFPGAMRTASSLVDRVTFGRVCRMVAVPEEVKIAACAAADCYYRYTKKMDRDVKSESNDGYSVTYSDVTASGKEAAEEAIARIRDHLICTGLLYRGYSEVYDNPERGGSP